MCDNRGVRIPGRGWRKFAASVVYPTMLLAVMISGCSSPHNLRWPRFPKDPRGPQPAQSWQDQANASQPAAGRPALTGRSKPPALAAGAPEERDGGVVRASAEPAASAPTGNPPTAVPPAEREYPIDLTTALRLAEAENPLIAEARQQIGEALAAQQGARALLFPTLNAGTNYHSHTGNLQRSSGRILNLNEKSLYLGGGAEALAAGTVDVPAVNIFSQLTDAIFEPLAARQQVEGARFNASATANNILLEVAELHFELLAAEADLRVRRQSADQAAEVARLTRAYARAQQGREADAERAATELSLIEAEVWQAEEEVAVGSARLARRLHLDQSVRVRPVAPVVETVTLVDPGLPLPGLTQEALRRRPEVGARAAALAAAEIRHREERYRPLLPTIWVGFSGGAFGGGSNLVGPELAHFAGRTDFDVQVFWTLRNLGAGNLSLQKRRWAEVGQAVGERSRAIAEIRSQVSAAYAEVAAARQQVNVTTRQLASAQAGFREDLERTRNTVGRPIELVNSLRLLNQARVARIRAVTDYNKAEFRLFVALGSPPPLGESAHSPLPPAPVAAPLLPPFAGAAAAPTGSGPRLNPPAVASRTSR
jgi:outer membrane protein TolC